RTVLRRFSKGLVPARARLRRDRSPSAHSADRYDGAGRPGISTRVERFVTNPWSTDRFRPTRRRNRVRCLSTIHVPPTFSAPTPRRTHGRSLAVLSSKRSESEVLACRKPPNNDPLP